MAADRHNCLEQNFTGFRHRSAFLPDYLKPHMSLYFVVVSSSKETQPTIRVSWEQRMFDQLLDPVSSG